MIRKKYILFDLDGTLTDPALGITNSVMYSLKKFGISVSDRSDLYKFIGPPLWESFINYYGFTREEANKAVEYYREYFKDIGIFENVVYTGIDDLLCSLVCKNKILILATSKPEIYAKRILKHFNLDRYFSFVAGSELDGTRIDKQEVIRYALRESNVVDLSLAVMIGDREYDIIGAKKAGIDSIGVLYGYGSPSELQNAGADYIVNDINDLITLFDADT